MEIVTLREEWLRGCHQAGATGATGAARSPQCAPSAEGTEERRGRERAIREKISAWFTGSRVTGSSDGRFVNVHVDIPACLSHGVEGTLEEMIFPYRTDERDTWRPRATQMLWNSDFYRARLRSVYSALADNSNFVSPLLMALDDDATSQDTRYGSQSIERAMVTVYYGVAMRALGQLRVPEPTCSTDRMSDRYTRGHVREKSMDYGRLIKEKTIAREVFDRARTHARGMPHGPGAVDTMADVYICARLAQPTRGSQVAQIAVRMACYIFVMAPHLVPVAPSASMAAVIAQRAHDKWTSVAREAGYDEF
jgi:hypothetical protein